eukprot:118330_1
MNAINLLNSNSGRNAIHQSFNINHTNNMNSSRFNYGNNNIYASTVELAISISTITLININTIKSTNVNMSNKSWIITITTTSSAYISMQQNQIIISSDR